MDGAQQEAELVDVDEIRTAVVEPEAGQHNRVVVDDVRVQLEGFYRDILWVLAGHMHKGGTAQGAATVVKKVALAWGLDVGSIPLPRLSRKQMDELRNVGRWRP